MNSSEKISRTYKAYKIAVAIVLCILAVASALAFTLGFEADLRYFNDSIIPIFLAIVSLAALGVALSSLFLFKKRMALRHPEPLLRFVAMLPMIAMIRLIIHVLWSEITRIFDAEAGSAVTIDTWTVLILISAVFAVIYNLSEIFEMNKPLKLISGFLQICFCIFVIAKLYVDFSVEINSPIKLLLQFSAAAMLLCTLADFRQELGISNAPAFLVSRICSASFGIASAAALFAEILPNADKYGDDYSVYPLLFIVCGIKAAVELFTSSVSETEVDDEDGTDAQGGEAAEKNETDNAPEPEPEETEPGGEPEADGEPGTEDGIEPETENG